MNKVRRKYTMSNNDAPALVSVSYGASGFSSSSLLARLVLEHFNEHHHPADDASNTPHASMCTLSVYPAPLSLVVRRANRPIPNQRQ